MSINRALKQDLLSVKGNPIHPFSFPPSGLTDNYSSFDREKELY